MKSRRIAVAAAGLVLLSSICSAAPSADDADSALGQDADYNAGRVALKNGDPAAAVRRFEAALARFPDAADLHNELGFAHRKLAHYDKAFKHYKRALAIDPRHRSAHEYIGETYLLTGDLPSAERHLAALRAICLLPCEELDDLARAVASYRSGRKTP